MNHITAFELPCADQSLSVLFRDLPGEVRDRIFTYVLSCYENLAKVWDKDSSYVRPNYHAPPIADTALLRTCQSVYVESWFRPWVSAVHTFWLAWEGRRPGDKEILTPEKLQAVLDQLYAAHGEVEINHIRVFSQLCSLEGGSHLSPILDLQTFFPRQITITVRHHDWCNWEDDEFLQIDAHWVNECRFPSSLMEISVELESLQRKKPQIDEIASQMVEGWHFQKKDGTIMSAKREDCSVDTWSGSSTWEEQRWIRDETKPETIEYYIKAVMWKPNIELTERPSASSLGASHNHPRIQSTREYLFSDNLKAAGIPPGLTADETLRRVEQWERGDPPSDPDTQYDNDGDEQYGDGLAHDSDQADAEGDIEHDNDEDPDFEL